MGGDPEGLTPGRRVKFSQVETNVKLNKCVIAAGLNEYMT